MNLATADLFQSEIARLQAEVARLRLAEAEREALEFVVERGHVACGYEREILRGLLERMK